MKWIILIGDEKFNLELIKEIEHFDCISITDLNSNRLVVDYGNDHIFYDYVENLIDDYEDKELQSIPFSNPKFIMLVYTSVELMKRTLSQVNYLRGIYVDNDEGQILPIEKFIKIL